MNSVLTLKLRIKDKHSSVMLAMARDVNTVWNFCNETQYKTFYNYCKKSKKRLSEFDLCGLTSGFVKCEGVTIGSTTAQRTCLEFARRLKQFNKDKLQWRVSDKRSPKYSLGWVPFKKDAIKYKSGKLIFNGINIFLWESYQLSDYELLSGSFNEDARGRWYFNVAVKVVSDELPTGSTSIGIDLGLKTMATYSDGSSFNMPRWYKLSELKLNSAKRANKKVLYKSIHTKIANQRKDAINKETTKLIKKHAAIFVGNVNPVALAKTNMAKSVNDAGWGIFKNQLKYKAIRHCVEYLEVNEAFSTQTCSDCGTLPDSRPRGIAGLGIRIWACSNCGSVHDRDVNAARNIFRLGHQALAVGAMKSMEMSIIGDMV